MTVRSITQSYEMSSEAGRERHTPPIPWARLTDATPTVGDPAQVTTLVPGQNMTGTVVNAGTAADPYVILNVAPGAIYRHNVRNVLTYDGANNEATWGAINIGDIVYYDATADANTAGVCKLSTSPLQGDAATANSIFGVIMLLQDQTASDFPTAATALSDQYAVMQGGINES